MKYEYPCVVLAGLFAGVYTVAPGQSVAYQPAPRVEQSSSKEKSKMSIAEQFADLEKKWREHCKKVQFSGDMKVYLNSPAFRDLVAMGRPAVPLIMEKYDDALLPWEFVVEEITGVKFIEDRTSINFDDAAKRRKQWWEKHQKEFPKQS